MINTVQCELGSLIPIEQGTNVAIPLQVGDAIGVDIVDRFVHAIG